MFKRILKTTIVAALALVLLPSQAQAIPNRWRNSHTTTQHGVTYRVDGKDAVVVKTMGRSVTIPKAIKYKGKKYTVHAIWDGALSKNKKLRKVDLRADLECCEDNSLFTRDSRNVRITVHTKGDYKWLTRKGNDSIVKLK